MLRPGSIGESLRVYWQPGCTSCLAAKQYLARHGLAFESINVRAQPEAMQTLAILGARSVPVVTHGERWIYAQELRQLAVFLGVKETRVTLEPTQLAARIDALLTATAAMTRQLPERCLEQSIAGREDRTLIDIPFHIAQIAAGLLDAAAGGELTYAHFERRPTGTARSVNTVAQTVRRVHERFSDWVHTGIATPTTALLRTYYGEQPLVGVLERTAWHIAQHARQLEHSLVTQGLQPSSPLGDRELAGLPLPDGVWDAERS